MCTIGAIIFGPDDYLLFKNKDFAGGAYDDRVAIKREWFGPLGLETFAEDGATPPVYSGLSIGANRHGLLVCVNHVRITGPHGRNYDLLVQDALQGCQGVGQALSTVRESLASQSHWWGNLVLTDGKETMAVEVRGQELRHETSPSMVFRANHQPLFGETASSDGVDCSAGRFAAAHQRVPKARTAEDVITLLKTHDSGESGICNHGQKIATVYSYVLHHKDGETKLHIAHGRPCQAPWHSLTPPLGDRWSPSAAAAFIENYPGGSAA